MPTGPGTMVDAGFIDLNGKITPQAKRKFIQDVKDEMKNGSGSSIFPCGSPLPPQPDADKIKLEDEKLYPDFHKNAIGLYEQIAVSLNSKGSFSILPICDPIALGAKIKPDLKVKMDFMKGDFAQFMVPNLPGLAAKLGFKPLPPDIGKLTAKFPEVGIPGVPDIPKPPLPPKIPSLGIDLPFDKMTIDYKVATMLIPSLLPEIVVKIPGLLGKLASLDVKGVMSEICKVISESGMFGSAGPNNFIQIAYINVLSRWTTAMVTSTAVGSVVGTSPAGPAAAPGVAIGAKDPEPEPEPDPDPVPATKLSSDGADFIIYFEKWWPTPYKDADGRSIGYGHFIKPGENFPDGVAISKDVGKALFMSDVAKLENVIRQNVSVPLNQNQFDALLSLIYNAGPDKIINPSFRIKGILNDRIFQTDQDAYPKAIMQFVYSQGKKLSGLVERRDAEGKLFTTAVG